MRSRSIPSRFERRLMRRQDTAAALTAEIIRNTLDEKSEAQLVICILVASAVLGLLGYSAKEVEQWKCWLILFLAALIWVSHPALKDMPPQPMME